MEVKNLYRTVLSGLLVQIMDLDITVLYLGLMLEVLDRTVYNLGLMLEVLERTLNLGLVM